MSQDEMGMAEAPSKNSENYTVVARRYRPTSFEQLIGQSQVATALTNAIKQDRIGHAYLFTGARGVGKTSTARIFAKCLNCRQGDRPTISPCHDEDKSNHCDVCASIESGEDVDVIEIDGASNNGVDNIRELRANANIRPSRARFKVYIIDEVHMLSKGAFNALLKTLEEPPQHVKFIFCTTEPDKIPITVRSRCQQFDFLPVQTRDIKKRLLEIAEKENVAADEAAITLLAQRAKGSMRDSQSLLEQLLSFTSGTISVEDVHQLLGTADTGILYEIAHELAGAQAANAMHRIAKAIDAGVDAGQLTEQLLAVFRDTMAHKVGCDPEVYLQASPDDQEQLAKLAGQKETQQLLAIMQILDKALVSMRTTSHGRTLLEMAAVRICNLSHANGIATLIAALQTGDFNTEKLAAAISASPASQDASKKNAPESGNLNSSPPESVAESSLGLQSGNRFVGNDRVGNGTSNGASLETTVADESARSAPSSGYQNGGPQPSNSPSATNQPTTNQPKAPTETESGTTSTIHVDPNRIEEYWKRTLAEIDDSTAMMAGEYQKVELVGNNQLIVTLTDSYNMEFCGRAEKKSRFEKVIAELTGQSFRIEFALNQKPQEAAAVVQPVMSRRKVIRQLHQHPMLNKAMEVFDAEITDYKQIKPK